MRSPDFICIGAMRCGTTTLWEMLRKMPDIYLPEQKELHYFDRDFAKGMPFYFSYFNNAALFQTCGEFTPDYLAINECCQRIREHLPQVRLIVILRDPVLRAWSHYRYSVRWGTESQPIKKALELERIRIENGGYHEDVFYSYKKRGQYIDQLQDYENTFSRDHIHVVFLEDLTRNKDPVLNGIRNHLGLKSSIRFPSINLAHKNELSDFPKNLHVHQITRNLKRSYQGDSILHRSVRKICTLAQQRNFQDKSPSIPKDVYHDLSAYYEPFDKRLKNWINRPLPWRNSV